MNIRFKKLIVLGAWIALCYATGQAQTGSSEQVQSALAKLEPNIRENLERAKVPGIAVAVVYNDQVVFLKGYGVRKYGELAPVDRNTVFEIASLSKPIASTILAWAVHHFHEERRNGNTKTSARTEAAVATKTAHL